MAKFSFKATKKEQTQMSKEAISKIREALGEDSSKVEAHLKAIESDYSKFEVELDDARETIKHVNNESKTRKLKIRDLESELEDGKTEMETLKGKDMSEEVKTLQTKLKSYEEAELERVKSKGKAFIDKYDKLKDHADWDKTKSKFLLPEEKDGKLSWESLDVNDIAKNADKLNEYEGLGLFSGANPKNEDKNLHRDNKPTSTGPFKDTDFK